MGQHLETKRQVTLLVNILTLSITTGVKDQSKGLGTGYSAPASLNFEGGKASGLLRERYSPDRSRSP